MLLLRHRSQAFYKNPGRESVSPQLWHATTQPTCGRWVSDEFAYLVVVDHAIRGGRTAARIGQPSSSERPRRPTKKPKPQAFSMTVAGTASSQNLARRNIVNGRPASTTTHVRCMNLLSAEPWICGPCTSTSGDGEEITHSNSQTARGTSAGTVPQRSWGPLRPWIATWTFLREAFAPRVSFHRKVSGGSTAPMAQCAVPKIYFDEQIAEGYDAASQDMFDPAVLDPAETSSPIWPEKAKPWNSASAPVGSLCPSASGAFASTASICPRPWWRS